MDQPKNIQELSIALLELQKKKVLEHSTEETLQIVSDISQLKL